MDHQSSEDQKLQAFDKFIDNKYYAKLFMTRTLKFVVSVSLLSLFLFVTSSGFCVLPDPFNQFNAYFSTLLLSIFTHTLERNCNDESDEDGIAYMADEGEEEPTLTSEEAEEEVGQLQDLEKQQNGSLYTENHEELQPEAFVEEEEEEEEEEVSESLMKQGEEETETQELATNSDVGDDQYDLTSSTDELNKKIEEFIRKMKEEIRIEAQRQPIIAA
ncbi:unnamed protein product [Malus baccata var. baccata]